jgi:hypothetical protein
MAMRLGIGNALVEQPGVQFVVALDPQARGEEALAHQPDLVLDLSLLPARCRRAGDRVDQVVPAHLQEPPVVGPLLAHQDRLDRRLHVVVDAARAGALEEGEGPVVGVEHHLLALARIGPHEQHPAVAEPDVSDLDRHRHPVDQHHLVAPVELVGLTRRKAQRHEGGGRRRCLLAAPATGIAADRIVAALVAEPANSSKTRISVSRSRTALVSFDARRPSRAACHGPILGRGWRSRSYSKAVAPERTTLRTVFRDTCRSRTISLIVLPCTKNSRRIRAIVSTHFIPRHPSRPKDRQCAKANYQGVNIGRR